MYPSIPLSPAQRADLHARARRQAQSLRRVAVTDFWLGVYRLAVGALRDAQRALHGTNTPAATTPVSRNPSGV